MLCLIPIFLEPCLFLIFLLLLQLLAKMSCIKLIGAYIGSLLFDWKNGKMYLPTILKEVKSEGLISPELLTGVM